MYQTITSEQVFTYKQVSLGCYQVLHKHPVSCPTSIDGFVYQTVVIGQIEKRWVASKNEFRWFQVGDVFNGCYQTRLAASYGAVKRHNLCKRWQEAF